MKKINKEIGLVEQLAGIIALTIVNEAEELLNEVPRVSKDKILVKQDIHNDKVVFTVKGELGDRLNNPDITFLFNEYLKQEDLPADDKLNTLVFNNYVTLSLMRYTIETK